MTGDTVPRIDGSVIVICGASSGIGRGAAVELARRGTRLVLLARRQDVLVDLVIKLREAGGEVIAVPGDISRESDVAAVAQAAVEEFGRIDIWINAVGVGALGLFWQVPAADQARVIDVNLRGLMFGAHFALSQFVSQGRGTLINLGLVNCDTALAYQTTHAQHVNTDLPPEIDDKCNTHTEHTSKHQIRYQRRQRHFEEQKVGGRLKEHHGKERQRTLAGGVHVQTVYRSFS